MSQCLLCTLHVADGVGDFCVCPVYSNTHFLQTIPDLFHYYGVRIPGETITELFWVRPHHDKYQ